MYKVGGYVRDKLLGIESQDIDYVVVGANAGYMHQLGFVPVGKHFPVFIDPKTQIQYALARTERKTGNGYHGFEFYATPDVTLEQDLIRRDITINAIAQDESGYLIDPFHGIDDLKHKIIRHISPAFAEDPLRVLRVARFKAKFGFDIANETLGLMQQICNNNELEHLSVERIWDEVRKTLYCKEPLEFFLVLNQVGALDHILNEFKIIIKTPYIKTKAHLAKATQLKYSTEEKFAIIISNIAQEDSNQAIGICKNCKLGHSYSNTGLVISQNQDLLFKLETLKPNRILQLIKHLDPIRKAQRFEQICKVLAITSPNAQYLEFVKEAANSFKQIDYSKFGKTNKNQYIKAINNTKLNIISNLYEQFFGI